MIHKIKRIFSPEVLTSALAQFGSISLSKFVLYTGIGLCVLGILVLIRLIRKQKILLSDVLTGIVLCIYISVIIQLTLVCRESGSRIGIELDWLHGLRWSEDHFHLLMWAYVLLNALLFVPYGFVWSLFSFVNERKWWLQAIAVLLICLLTSMGIEYTQLFTGRGYFEVQDMIFNTLGGGCGWLIFSIMDIWIRQIKKRSVK